MRLPILSLSFLILASPLTSQASSCSDIINQIHQDTVKYAQAIQSQHLPWMKLDWLQKKLGKAEITGITETQVQYEWQCPNDTSNTLSVSADKSGIISMKGKFSDAESAGLYSVCLSEKCNKKISTAETTASNTQQQTSTATTQPPATLTASAETQPSQPQTPAPQPAATPAPQSDNAASSNAQSGASEQPEPSDEPTKDEPKALCSNILKQMHEIDPKIGVTASYPWESLDWLKKKLGEPKIKDGEKGIAYYWLCSEEKDGTSLVMYHIMPDKTVIYQGISCNKTGCDIDNILRHDKDLRNAFMHINLSHQ